MVLRKMAENVRLGINTDVALGILVAGLLSWVGISTHNNEVTTARLEEKIGAVLEARVDERRRAEHRLERLEERLEALENGR